jgi:lipopolysaccharide biosynthesis protein
MNRLTLFAHFDADDEVKRYVVYYLERLRAISSRVVFVSTSRLSSRELEKVAPHVDRAIAKDNSGYDFGMWQRGLDGVDLAACDELVLTNSSVFGPIYPLEPIFQKMGEDPCDFWGMTDNFEYRWHLQTYFLVFKRRALASPAFGAFFRSVLPYRNKGQVVMSYELGLTAFLVDNDLRPGALAPIESWASWAQRRRMDLERRWNPTLFYPEKLLSLGMPFVKVMLLRDNVGDVPLEPVYRAIEAAGYDRKLLEFDARAKPRDESLRAKARRLWGRIAIESEGSPLALAGGPKAAPSKKTIGRSYSPDRR